MPRPTREAIMTALLNRLSTLQISFTATTQAGNAVLSNPSVATGFFIGMPVFGPGIPPNAVVQSLNPLTLSLPAMATAISPVALLNGFQTFGRRLKMWPEISEQPALFLRDKDEDLEYRQTSTQLQLMNAEVWICSNAGQDPDFAPAIALNNCLDAVQGAMAPDNPMTNQFTLGGLVSWCRLSGKVDKATGDLDGQAIAVADVEIFIP